MDLICKMCGKPFQSERSKRQFCSVACRNRANNAGYQQRLSDKPVSIVWACGGGVQSAAIAALIVSSQLPKPTLAFMTDTGWEQTSTMQYVHDVIQPRLASVGVELAIIKTVDYTTNALFDSSGHVVLPAYRYFDGKAVKFNTHCNGTWKLQPARRWMREQGVQRCENWIGISHDERHRRRRSNVKWCQNAYPLVERGLTREDCLHLLGSAGWPKPEHSSCIICPLKRTDQWLLMKKHFPMDWKRAIEAEKAIQKSYPDVYLHRSMRPLSELAIDKG